MPDTSHETSGDAGTPIYDAVLADRLQAAARSVAQAEQDAATFRAALDGGQTQAIEQLAERRARELLDAQTLTVTTQRDLLERQARVVGDRLAGLAAWHTGDATCRACGEAMPCTTTQVLAGAAAPAPPEPAPEEPEPEPAEPQHAVDVVTLEAQAVAAEAAHAVESHHEPVDEPVDEPVEPTERPAEPPAAAARDGGPAAREVPSVPSMKDLFSSTRAASWLDNLLGAKR